LILTKLDSNSLLKAFIFIKLGNFDSAIEYLKKAEKIIYKEGIPQ